MSNVISVRDVETGHVTQLDLEKNTRTMRDSGGRLVTMDMGVSDVHIDSALANVAFGYKLADGVADIVAPVVTTPKASDKYFLWDKDDVLQPIQNLVVASGGAVTELSPRVSNTAFSTTAYALQAAIPTELEANADSPLRPRIAATRRLMAALMLGREVRVAAAARLATNYATAFKATIASGAQWNGGASSAPLTDIYTRCEAALMPINRMIMSERTWHDFVLNANVQKFIAYKSTVAGTPSPQDITGTSALLGLPPITVAAMKYKTAASTYDYVWGNDVVLIHSNPGLVSDGQDVSTMYTYRWSGGGMALTEQGGFFVRTYFDDRRGPRGSTIIVVGHNDAEVFTSDAVSGLLVNAHQ